MSVISSAHLIAHHRDARQRTLALVRGLSHEQLLGPRLDIVNPLLWEIGHVAWFHEYWILRHLDGRQSFLPNADVLYDSIAVGHDRRWDLPLPSLSDTLQYMENVLEAVEGRLSKKRLDASDIYFYQHTAFHEDMHDEAFTYTRQTLSYPAPQLAEALDTADEGRLAGPLPGDVSVPGGTFMLGAEESESFVFDNEKWAHPVEIKPFRIARAPVTNTDYAGFVDDGGYHDRALWDPDGWEWRRRGAAEHPQYWVKAPDGQWQMRLFDSVVPLPPHAPVIHVNWFEADAYCRWAGRRLPTEAEWEAAAAGEPAHDRSGLAPTKRRFPWGDMAPGPQHANLEGRAMGCVDVAALPAGDSAFGCRQLIGNVWEWTCSDFLPYPGFVVDPYKDYSEPWFGTRKVLRGGCWATRGRMLRNTWRNFYTPERNDVFAGFRTCAQ